MSVPSSSYTAGKSTPSPSSSPLKTAQEKSKVTATWNPISLRLYKVLGTNYEDPEFREALETLSDLYSVPDDSRIPSFKGKGVDQAISLSLPTEEDPITVDTVGQAREKLVSSSVSAAARARKSLKRDAELELTRGTQQFLKAFQEVDNQLDVLQQHIDDMRRRCDEAQNQLKSTNESCQSLLERAGGLRNARHKVNEQQLVIDSFLKHFSLTQEEVEILQSRDVQINAEFFTAMRKAERIIEDSRILMNEDGPTKAGVDIIATTSHQLEQGYDKIARWCALEFRQFVRHALLEVSPFMAEAVNWLRKKPDLLSEALSALSQTRQATLLNAFMDALTRGGPNGFPRPIEIHAHDPLRYVGDMLAWVHQSIAGEREFLESLFSVRGDDRMVGSIRRFEQSEEEEWIRELMDKAFERLKSPLKMRVRQTVRSQESCITSYKIANLLSFYNLTMRRTVGEKAGISDTLNEITDEAYKIFFDTIESQARSLARSLLPEDQDLQPPVVLLDHTQVLREIMSVYRSSVLGDETEIELRDGFKPVLDLMVDAAVNMCIGVSEARHTQRPGWDKDIFILNCMTYLLNVIRPYDFADNKAKDLQHLIDSRAESLITDHYITIIHDTSLHECLAICDNNSASSDPEPISHIGSMQPQPLGVALRAFSTWLSSPDVVRPPRLSPLIDQRLAEHVHRAALCQLVDAYDKICTEVRKPENRYEAANTLLGNQRPFGNLSALKQILSVGDDAISK